MKLHLCLYTMIIGRLLLLLFHPTALWWPVMTSLPFMANQWIIRVFGYKAMTHQERKAGHGRKRWYVCCVRFSCSSTWCRYYWSTVVECQRQQFSINWPGKWMWRCRQIPHNPFHSLSAVHLLLCDKYILVKGWVLLWRAASGPVLQRADGVPGGQKVVLD